MDLELLRQYPKFLHLLLSILLAGILTYLLSAQDESGCCHVKQCGSILLLPAIQVLSFHFLFQPQASVDVLESTVVCSLVSA